MIYNPSPWGILLWIVLPGLLPSIYLIAIAIIVFFRKQLPRSWKWAVLGFGWGLFVHLFGPFIASLLDATLAQIVLSSFRAPTHIFLLIAILAGRTKTELSGQPPVLGDKR